MKEPLKIVLVGTLILLSSAAASLIIVALRTFLSKRRADAEPNPERDPKIYYITDAKDARKKKKARKKLSPALKGIVLSPEEFKKIPKDTDGRNSV